MYEWVSFFSFRHASGKPFRFHSPSSILVVGPSGCGKTVFTEKLLLENPELFETLLPKCIIVMERGKTDSDPCKIGM